MKTILIIIGLIAVVILGQTGCRHQEGVDYIGVLPYYAVDKNPHPENCGCCLNKNTNK